MCGKTVEKSYIKRIASGTYSIYFALASCMTFIYTIVYYTDIFMV